AAGLGAVDLEIAVDEPEVAELAERLRHLGQDRPAGDRHDDVLRQPPAELLGDLEAVGFRALGVVRPYVDVDERPAVLVGDLAAQAVDVLLVAAGPDPARAGDAPPHHPSLP